MAWRILSIPNSVAVKTSYSAHTDTAIRYKNVMVTENGIETLPFKEAMSNSVELPQSNLTLKDWLLGAQLYKAKYANGKPVWLLANRYGLWAILEDTATKLIHLENPTDTFLVPYHFNGKSAFIFGANSASVKMKMIMLEGFSTPLVTDIFLPTPQVSPVVNSTSIPDREPVLYRYRYTYYDTETGLESAPSPITTCYGDPLNSENPSTMERHNNVWGRETSIPSGVDKIRIYRWTENVNAWFKIGELNASLGWRFDDTYPAGEIFTDMLYAIAPLDIIPTAMAYHNERLFVASGSIVYVSDVGRPSFRFGLEEGSDDPTLGGYVNMSGEVLRLVSWKTHVLAFTTVGCFRLIEDNGVFFALPAPIPQPLNKHCVFPMPFGMVLLTADGVVAVSFEEDKTVLPFDWELFFQKKQRYPVAVRPTKQKGEDVLDIQFVEETQDYTAVSYLRFGKNITGEHTLGRFWSGV